MKSGTLDNIYYGWKNLAGSFLCAAVAISCTTYIFGVFTVPVSEEFGVSRANFNNGMIAFMIGLAILSPVVGHWLDRFSARTLLITGGLIFSGSLAAIASLHNLWLMLAIIALPLTFATAASGMICANTVTVRWFHHRRGRALGILALSTSVGGFVAQPLAALLIEAFGWRGALYSLSGIALIVFMSMGLFVIRDRPNGSENGYDDEFGDDHADESRSTQPTEKGVSDQLESAALSERSWTGTELLRNRNFWLLSVCIGVMFGVDQAVLVSQVPFFQDIGYDLTTAALLVSVKTISAIAGKLIIGYLADRIDLRLIFTAVAGCNATLMTIYISQPDFWILVTAVAFLGVAVGGIMPVWTTMMAWLFGARSYGTVMGMMSIIMQPFAIVTLRFVGALYDSTGSYLFPFTVFIGVALTAIALVWLLRPQSKPQSKG